MHQHRSAVVRAVAGEVGQACCAGRPHPADWLGPSSLAGAQRPLGWPRGQRPGPPRSGPPRSAPPPLVPRWLVASAGLAWPALAWPGRSWPEQPGAAMPEPVPIERMMLRWSVEGPASLPGRGRRRECPHRSSASPAGSPFPPFPRCLPRHQQAGAEPTHHSGCRRSAQYRG